METIKKQLSSHTINNFIPMKDDYKNNISSIKIFCPQCRKEITPKESLKIKTDGNYMIRGECPLCNKWLKWMPYADSLLVKQAIKLFSTLPENEALIHD